MITVDNYLHNNLMSIESYSSGTEFVRNLILTEGSDAIVSSMYVWYAGSMYSTWYYSGGSTAFTSVTRTLSELAAAITADSGLQNAGVLAQIVETWNGNANALYVTAPIASAVCAQFVRYTNTTVPNQVTQENSTDNGVFCKDKYFTVSGQTNTPCIKDTLYCDLTRNYGSASFNVTTTLSWTGTTTIRIYSTEARTTLLTTYTGTMAQMVTLCTLTKLVFEVVGSTGYFTLLGSDGDPTPSYALELDKYTGELPAFASPEDTAFQYLSDYLFSYHYTAGSMLGNSTVTRHHEYYTILMPEYTSPSTIATDTTSRLKYGTNIQTIPDAFIISENSEKHFALANRLEALREPKARAVIHIPMSTQVDITERVRVKLRGQTHGIFLAWAYDAVNDIVYKEFIATGIRDGQNGAYKSLTLMEVGNIRLETEDDDMIIGGMCFYAGTVEPVNYFPCDGRELAIATYPQLAAAVNSGFLTTGNGTTTFNLPDLRGRIPVGLDNMGGASINRITASAADSIGGVYGVETPALLAHTHGIVTGNLDNTGEIAEGQTAESVVHQTQAASSGDQTSGNIQPSIFGLWVIRYQ